ncbi:MAG: ImmA/IrrE family metallo-endopeptidase [Bacteroidia bacterium]|nr:ImmA/IrrE family metallo-endopeptidase [Bacteroidia bacterium]
MIATETKINTGMIVLARESRGLSQKDLADRLGISPGKLSKAESGEQNLSEDQIVLLEQVLAYPREFFYQDAEAFLSSNLSFRKRHKVPQKMIFPIEARINVFRLQAEWLFRHTEKSSPKIPVFEIAVSGSPVEAARKLRKQWKIHAGMIENMSEVLESHEIPVLSFDFGTERVDSRLVLTKEQHPLIFLNSSMLGDRQRFSLAIELGHLVMHAHTNPAFDRNTGHESNLFASEFLMPEDDIRPDFKRDVTVNSLAELKRKWKVSMHALLYRAEDLGCISKNQKTYLLTQFNQLQIRRREPRELDVPVEKSRLMRDLITSYRRAQRLTIKEMATSLHLTEEEFLKIYSL